MLTPTIQQYIQQSVLCWLATVDADGCPNVSPKELFLSTNEQTFVIAHVASPQSIKNIKTQAQVCVSFVDVFVQKGYKIKGQATLVNRDQPAYDEYTNLFQQQYGNAFAMTAFIVIEVTTVAPILAPSYLFYPETTEASQIQNALATYRVKNLLEDS
ncbi:MAG: pyridoxamine 5'-phosphate oxidase family protein [Aureispira sp.]